MIKAIFTLDYEIHGNGEGCAHQLMVQPTDRLLRLFDEYGARLTIMADVAEILKFKEYAEQHGKDDYHFGEIAAQLQDAVRRGHDVQLHVHASYFNAKHDGRRWVQDWSEYNFAGLSFDRLNEIIKLGRTFLESLIRPANPDYRCSVFRAANWSVSPSANLVRALINNGIHMDTSVFKYGRREGIVTFDYGGAYSEMVPWRGDTDRIWRRDPKGEIWEVPIYSENRWIGAFLSPTRIYRILQGRLHRVPADYRDGRAEEEPKATRRPSESLGSLTRKHAWKADFNQCTGRQLIAALNRAEKRHNDGSCDLPFVLIGHSKLYTQINERSLRPFLAYVAQNASRFGFATFALLDLERMTSLQPQQS